MLQTDVGKRMEVNIPRGVKTGSKVRMRGDAEQPDIYLKINVMPDERFTREGNDLRANVQVPLYTALLGGEVQVPTLDGGLMLTIPAGTQNGRTFRLRGQGMPHLRKPDERGDLFAAVQVTLPAKLSEEERKLFEELRCAAPRLDCLPVGIRNDQARSAYAGRAFLCALGASRAADAAVGDRRHRFGAGDHVSLRAVRFMPGTAPAKIERLERLLNDDTQPHAPRRLFACG